VSMPPPPPPQPAQMTWGNPDEVSPRSGFFTRTAGRVQQVMPASQRAWRARQAAGSRLPVPGILSERRILIATWLIAMMLITMNERQQGYQLPRPARLWSASAVYGILAAASTVEAVVPVTNALGIGYMMVLAYDYYNSSGQFGTQEPGTVLE
jgi:hypothetical protein